MSGRKRSEVVDLLSSGERIRKEILSNSYKNINSILKKNEKVIEEIEKGLKILKELLPTFPENIKRDYEKDIKTIEGSLKIINNWRDSVKIEKLDKVENDLKNIDNNFSTMDIKAQELRNSISGKDWYCDQEYREAQDLVKQYKDLEKKVFNLRDETTEKFFHNSEVLEKTNYNIRNKEELKEQIRNLENRIEADNHKDQLIKEFKEIDNILANKFLSKEYKDLEKSLNEFILKDTNHINIHSGQIYNKITSFVNKLVFEKEKFDLKKEKTEREFESLKLFVKSFEFKDIEALIEERDEKLDIFTFQEKYCNESFKENYLDILRCIDKNIKNENFDEALIALKTTRDLIVKESNKCTNTYERLLKEQDMVSKIVSAVYELGYDFQVDGDPRDGYSIEAILGDEIINFDKISIDENGTPIIDIDHQEGVGGTCGNTMGKLLKALQYEGIFITDITKNGRSAIYLDKEENKWKNTNKTEARR